MMKSSQDNNMQNWNKNKVKTLHTLARKRLKINDKA